MRAPRVLVLGSVLGQDMGGVLRHNAELLPRASRLLEANGGSLAVAVGSAGLGIELPPEIERLETEIPPRPPLVRATLEGRWVRRLLKEAEEAGRPFDLIHTAHHPVPRHLPAPHSLMVHDLRALSLEHSPMSRRLFARQILGYGIERAACVETVSEAVRAEVLATFRVDPERVSVVPNGADHLEVLPRAAGPGSKLLALGHLEPRKNLGLLLEALSTDLGLPPLQLAGLAKGDEEQRLRSIVADLGLSARVEFLGPVQESDLPGLFARAACVVCPSSLEGFGIVAVEAARAGAPLAVSAIPAHEEVTTTETPRFGVDNAAACARAIRAALAASDDSLVRARVHVERFTWDAAAEALVRAWQRCGASVS